MISSFIRDGFLFTLTKYVVVLLGLFRTIIVAGLLTKSELGALALVLLVFEYLALLSPLGAVFSFNKSSVNLQSKKSSISIEDSKMEIIYRSTTFIIILGLLTSIFLLVIINAYTNILPADITTNLYTVIFISILSVYRTFGIIHNRIWRKFNIIIIMEISYAFVYLIGIFFVFKGGENFINSYLNIIIAALVSSILCSRFIPKFKVNFKVSPFPSSFFKVGLILMAFNFLETFFWGLDRIFIAFYLLPSQLADFHIAHTWSRGFLMAYMALAFLFTSELMKQVTLTEDTNKNSMIRSKIQQLSRSSETILVFLLMFALIIIPFAINITMNKYTNIQDVLILVLLGLILKGMCFFPSSYMIANSLQKRLTLISVSFTILASITYYSLKNYISSPEEYLSISIVIFLLYLITINIFKEKNFHNFSLDNILIYNRISLITILMISVINYPGVFFQINNSFLLTILIIIFYNKLLILTCFNLFNFIRYRDKNYIRKILLN